MDKYSYISNAHVAYIDELYQYYRKDPESVEPGWKQFFDGFDFAICRFGEKDSGNGSVATTGSADPASKANGHRATSGTMMDMEELPKEIKVRALIHAYRSRGHLKSKTNPVRERVDRKALIGIEYFGLDEADLNTEFQAGEEIGIGRAKLSKILEALNKIYVGPMGFEYLYIRDPEMLDWLRVKIEKEALEFSPSLEIKKRILSKL